MRATLRPSPLPADRPWTRGSIACQPAVSRSRCPNGRSTHRVPTMSLIVVVLAVSLIVGTKWTRIVLADEDRYLWAVSPLAVSPMIARLAGACVPIALRHRGRWRRSIPPSVARTAGTRTSWAMGTRAFHPSWMLCHRMLHRHRRSHWRITALMILLATTGPVIRATSRVLGPAAGPYSVECGREPLG